MIGVAEKAAHEEHEGELRPKYLEALALIERLHRRLLDVIKDEFERKGRDDVNAVQALLLYNIGGKELTASELRSRGYYLGSNVSYNVKKLVELGYLHHQRSTVDRRTVRISLTQKGQAVSDMIAELYSRHLQSIDAVGGLGHPEFAGLNKSLQKLERFWTDQILYKL
ncbi:transcriptional regulator LdtR [Tepidamorphus sp. 3E244]|uniref:transcriptional regulator LdtR n=1 Tax=Tepidamorphus sp. 3E244 TaxID=3385498 RepID=UPI0038FC0B87